MLSAINHLLLSCLQSSKCGDLAEAPAPVEIRYTTKNPSILKPVSRAAKTRKTVPKLPKNANKRPRNQQQNDFCEQLVFAMHSMRGPAIKTHKRRHFESEIDNKSNLGTSPKTKWNVNPRCPKNFQNRVPKSEKSMKILFWTTSCPSCCSNGPPGLSRGAKMVVPKRSPRVSKWRHRALQMATARS